MISFDTFVKEDGSPIYLQILRYIKRGVVAGVIRDGDELPSRRVLSALLGVNPNTVQKACRTLEEEGLLRSYAGARSLMWLDEARTAAIRTQLLADDALAAVRSLRQMGVSRAEAMALLEQAWDLAEAAEAVESGREAVAAGAGEAAGATAGAGSIETAKTVGSAGTVDAAEAQATFGKESADAAEKEGGK